jgi:membrane protease YdiL (CAAX protease family)
MQSTRLSTIIGIFKFPPVRKPSFKDVPPFFFSFGALLLTGAVVWGLSFLLPAGEFPITKPEGAAAWMGIVLLCLFTGYWEEGVFRLYFLTICDRAGMNRFASVLVSSLAFAFCHSYEGMLGMVNAGTAGVLLSIVYLKTGSYHGPALAHAMYNILAYILFSPS